MGENPVNLCDTSSDHRNLVQYFGEIYSVVS